MGWAEGGRAVLRRLSRIRGKLSHPVSMHPTPEGGGHDLENNRSKIKTLERSHLGWGCILSREQGGGREKWSDSP